MVMLGAQADVAIGAQREEGDLLEAEEIGDGRFKISGLGGETRDWVLKAKTASNNGEPVINVCKAAWRPAKAEASADGPARSMRVWPARWAKR